LVREQNAFLLSPANLNGKRGRMLLNPDARFELARTLRSAEGAALVDVYSFVSGLYFRGKASYASTFSSNGGPSQARIITPGGGLCRFDERVTVARLEGWQRVRVSDDNPHFSAPLLRHACELADALGPDARFVLLGSVASSKYVVPLLEALGPRLYYPAQFAGLGDMSRGSLLLRCVREGRELEYVPVETRRWT
jgi:hypothetical protein